MPKQQVHVELSGGIGNQLFQYAAALGLSRRLSAELVLDVSWYQRALRQGPSRFLELETCLETGTGPQRSSTRSPYWRHFDWLLRHQLVLRDDNTTPDEFLSISTSRNIRLKGYWQNRNYFAPIASHLLDSFRRSLFISSSSLEVLQDISHSTALGVHVRRGDYVMDPRTRAYHGVSDMSYYHRAVNNVCAATHVDRIFVFSDDVEWCKKNIHFDVESTIVSGSIPDTDQLKLLARCQHHVISNSSYSWWAAWFGQSESQVVMFPKRWFADGRGLEDPPARWSPV